jgi:DNA replication protein
MIFQEKEQNPFPSMEELAERMSVKTDQVAKLLRNLHQNHLIQINQERQNGLLTESYSLLPLWQRLAELCIEEVGSAVQEESPSTQQAAFQQLIQQFEHEFGRPLSPFEYEMLSQWIDQDGHSEELIETALQEAIFCGKLSFRYIDRILLEWKRNQITTVNQAIEFARKFRRKGLLYRSTEVQQAPVQHHFSFYNWVKQE